MKKTIKKLLAIALAVLVVFGGTTGVGLLKDTAIKANAATLTLNELKAKFPDGKYWNHGTGANDPNKCTDSPCAHAHGSCSFDGSCGCNSFNGEAIQCFGFALKLGYDAYGSNPKASWTRAYNLDNLKAGDIVNYNGNGHTVFVIGVSGNTVTVAECNTDNHCKITWGRSLQKSQFTNLLNVYVAPYELDTGSDTPVDPPHTHSYSSSVTAPTCTEQGYTTHTCDCGDSYTDTYVAALGHDYIKTITSVSTCTKAGEASYKCSRCPASYTEPVAALGHDEGVWKLDYEATLDHDGQLSRYCLRCGAYIESKPIAKHEHTLGEAEIIRPATCTEEGLEARICSVCGMCTEIESFSAKGHCEKPAEVTAVAPTCTEKGEKAFYCTDCGLVLRTEEVPALGHDDGIWTTDKSETCTENGEKLCYCSRCGELTGSETVPAKGHSEESIKIVTTPATCTSSGEAELRCADCGTVVGTEKISSLGHDDGVWSVSVAPTCELEGEEICTCTRCGEKIGSRKVTALGHDSGVWKIDFEATADHNGQMTKYCSRCNISLGETKTFALHTHTEGYRATIIAPECEKEGMGGIFCATCGVQYGTYTIAELSHNYSDWHMNNDGTHAKSCSRCHDVQILNCRYDTTVTAPTCLDFGYTTHVCKDCGYMYTDSYIEPLGHDLSEWVADDECTHSRACCRENCSYTECEEHEMTKWIYNVDGTICHNGTKTRFCPVCGYEETEEAQHSNFFGKIIHTVWIWFLNVIFKIDYIIGLNWLFPWMNIYPQM